MEYKPFDADHAIPELAAAARFVADNPCCDKSEFPKDVPDFEKHVAWLVSTGHVVAFTNGVFSAVEKYPKYGPQWKKRGKKPAAPNAEEAETQRRGEEETAVESQSGQEAASTLADAPNPCQSVKSVAENPVEKSVEEAKNETAPVVAE